jgi:hypothetical protein
VVRVGADEGGGLAIGVGGLEILAAGLVDHADAVVAVMDLGEAFEEVVGGLLRLVEAAFLDQVGDDVGGGFEAVVVRGFDPAPPRRARSARPGRPVRAAGSRLRGRMGCDAGPFIRSLPQFIGIG